MSKLAGIDEFLGPDLQNILRFIVRLSEVYRIRSTYDSHLKRAKISHSESNLRTLFSDNLTILKVDPT